MTQVKQAVVIVHGMGEQRPLDTLNRFIKAAITRRADDKQTYYSQPDRVTDSFESRRYIAPRYAPDGVEAHAQTEFYEYHWAHLMQGNKLGDLWPTFRKMLLRSPRKVPAGLRFVWGLFWVLLAVAAWRLTARGWDDGGDVVQTLVGTGAAGTVLLYVVTRVLPGALTNSFVDVVRYLDTSPRSYEVRREIRKGMVDLLRGLHENERYDRIVVVAHSLGAYIAYDGIAYLWAHKNKVHGGTLAEGAPDGLAAVERLASDLPATPTDAQVDAFQAAQRALWLGLRAQGNPWLVTDFVSVGTPMYFADELYARSPAEFKDRVKRWEFPTCPPQSEGGGPWNNVNDTKIWFSWRNGKRRVLYHGAPFAAVRWTNMWFPARYGVFGDWFGGPLAPVFGRGIKDVPLTGNGWKQRIPALAHTLYFSFPDDLGPASVTTALQRAIGLASTAWLEPATNAPKPDPDTARGSSQESEPGYGGQREPRGPEAADARPRRPRKGAGQHVDTGRRRRP